MIGTIIGYSSPQRNGTINNQQFQARNTAQLLTGNTRARIYSQETFNKIIFLGDATPGSQLVFACIMLKKGSLYDACLNSTLGDELRLGDTIGVYQPRLSNKTLGGTIPILDDYKNFFILSRAVQLPQKPIRMASEANHMIHFHQRGVTVAFSNALILTGDKVPCVNNTCDRQLTTCKGCSGRDVTTRNMVLSVLVEVENQHEYNSSTGVATFKHRSMRFTKLAIRNLSVLANMDYDVMRRHDEAIEDGLVTLANLVNGNGGWTVVGWHRRGVVSPTDDGNYRVSSDTEGHLVLLQPTHIVAAQRLAFENARITMQP